MGAAHSRHQTQKRRDKHNNAQDNDRHSRHHFLGLLETGKDKRKCPCAETETTNLPQVRAACSRLCRGLSACAAAAKPDAASGAAEPVFSKERREPPRFASVIGNS